MSEWGFGCTLCIFVMSVLFSSLGSSEAAWSIFKWKGSGYGSLSSQQTVTDAQRCRGCLGVSFLTQKWQHGHWLPRWLTYCRCSRQAAGNKVRSKGLGLIIWAPLLFLSFLFRPPACASGSWQQRWHLSWRRADEGYWLWGRRSQRAAGPWWAGGLCSSGCWNGKKTGYPSANHEGANPSSSSCPGAGLICLQMTPPKCRYMYI